MDGRKARSDETRVRMLSAGESLLQGGLSAEGLKATRICAAAGGSQSSFYNIFGRRDTYVLELHRTLLERAASGVHLDSGSNGSTSVARLANVVRNVLDVVAVRCWFFPAFAPLERLDPSHAQLRREFDRSSVAAVREAVPGPSQDAARWNVTGWAIVTAAIRGTTGRVPFVGTSEESRQRTADSIAAVLARYLERSSPVRPRVPLPTIPPFPQRTATARTRILDAAEELLAHHDSLDMRMLELMIASDVSVSTIYDEFGSKLGVIEAVLGRLLDDALAMSEKVLDDEQLGSHADLTEYLCHTYALLSAFMTDRFHILGAFETPGRLTDEVATQLAAAEDQLISRGLELSPRWEGDVDQAILAIRMSKVVLQQVSGTGVSPRDLVGLSLDDLIRELAVMTSGVARISLAA